MLPAFFISDAHLGCKDPQADPQGEAKLIALLKSWQGAASHLVLVGDVFEFWMEYKHYIAFKHWGFLRALAELAESGVKVHILKGNHDFALGSFFPKYLGVEVHRELELTLQGKKVYFTHGDGLAAGDRSYRIMRRILDFPLNQYLFKLLHPDWGYALAQKVGGLSRKAGEGKCCPWGEYESKAKQLLKKKNADVVVHGHTHIAQIATYPEGTHINCGNWLFDLNYIEFKNSIAQIKTYEE